MDNNHISSLFDKDLNKYLLGDIKQKTTFFDIADQLKEQNTSLNQLLAIDYKTFLLDNNLAKVDRATMSVGLEGREPFLDHRIIEFVAKLPDNYKIRNGVHKSILKDIEPLLNGVHFANKKVGCMVGDDGNIFFTENRGENWKKIEIETTNDLESCFFTNENTGFIVGKKGTIIKITLE